MAPRTQAPPAPRATGGGPGAGAETSRGRDCGATESNPGGDNNYIPDAPAVASLGEGFLITGRVRSAKGCRPLAGVPIQVWLATETGGETDNRATVRTGEDGRYRIETAPTVPQFGEPDIHVAYDGERFEQVFISRVVDLDEKARDRQPDTHPRWLTRRTRFSRRGCSHHLGPSSRVPARSPVPRSRAASPRRGRPAWR